KREEEGIEEDDDDDLASDSPDDQALLYRIEQVKKLKPDPPENSERRGLVSHLTGNSIHSTNVELLQREEDLLREWVAVVRYQKRRAEAARKLASAFLSRKRAREATEASEVDPETGGSTGNMEESNNDEAVLNSVYDEEQQSSSGDENKSTSEESKN
ncbi:MAG: hypothetical protein SGARI_004708, partial [Bacillariaceae sp.]